MFGSALLALQGDSSELGEPSIHRLLDALDKHIPNPVRDITSPFILPIDNAIGVPGRGSVCIGTIKQGNIESKFLVDSFLYFFGLFLPPKL